MCCVVAIHLLPISLPPLISLIPLTIDLNTLAHPTTLLTPSIRQAATNEDEGEEEASEVVRRMSTFRMSSGARSHFPRTPQTPLTGIKS
jgi:hypothetical protein